MSIPPQGNTSTAIVEAGTAVAGATANTVLYVDAAGLLASEAAFTYDESSDTLTALNIVASTTLKASNLTATRIPYATTGGQFTDDSTFTFTAASDLVTVDKLTVSTGPLIIPDGTVGAPGIKRSGDATGFYFSAASVAVAVIGNNWMTWDGNGVITNKTILPQTDNAFDLGLSSSLRFRKAYIIGMHENVYVDAGSGTGQAVLGGPTNKQTTAVGNVGAGEDDLMTYSLPTDSFNAAGRSVRVTVTGTAANTAAAKTLKFYFGSQVFSVSLTTNQAGVWKAVIHITSTGTDAQDYNYEFFQDGATEIHSLAHGTLTENDGAAITIKCTGEATNNDDIVQEFMLVEFFN